MMYSLRQSLFHASALLLLANSFCSQLNAQGVLLSAAGPNSRSIGGATTAAPVSAMSALHWNPATIRGMHRDELEVGLDFFSAKQQVASSFGPYQGETTGESGPFPIPNFGWVHHTSHHAFSVGLGVNSVAGFKTILPADPTNPVLAPAPVGLGAISSEASFIQISPVLAFAASEQLSFAIGPTLTLGQMSVTPFVLDAANADGTYSPGRGGEAQFGGGLQIGVYYQTVYGWDFGASLKSPSWMSPFEYHSTDENGLPRTLRADFDLPMILSLGTAIHSFEKWLFSADVRFIDYASTNGFGDPAVFQPDGRLEGLDWSSVFAASIGAQRSIGDRLVVGTGYAYNQSPIQNSESFFNIASPLFYQHMLSGGLSFALTDSTKLSTAYSRYFDSDVQGPIVSPIYGPLPGSSVRNSVSANIFSFGISFLR